MVAHKSAPIDWETLLAGITHGKTLVEYGADRRIFDQGQPADSIFYVRKGKVQALGYIPTRQGSDRRHPERR